MRKNHCIVESYAMVIRSVWLERARESGKKENCHFSSKFKSFYEYSLGIEKNCEEI